MPPSMATPHFATRSPPPSTVTELVAFARERMQSAPVVVVVTVDSATETTARALRIGVVIGLIPRPDGLKETFVLSHCAVFCVISTTIQGGDVHQIWRESRAVTEAQSPAF